MLGSTSQIIFSAPETLHRRVAGGGEEVHELHSNNSDEIDPDDPSLGPFTAQRQQSPGEETHGDLPSATTSPGAPPLEEFDPELFEMEGSTNVFCESLLPSKVCWNRKLMMHKILQKSCLIVTPACCNFLFFS